MAKEEQSTGKMAAGIEKIEHAMIIEIKGMQTKRWIAKVKVAFITKGALCVAVTEKQLPFHLIAIIQGKPYAIFCNEHNTCSETVKRCLRDINRQYDLAAVMAWKDEEGKIIINNRTALITGIPTEEP